MALTSDEINYIRAMTGDTDSSAYYLTDTELNYLHSNKADSDVEKTIAWALRQMCRKAFRKVGRTNSETGNSFQANQERDHLCEEADKAANLVGINTGQLGTVTIGTINLGIDEEDEDFDIT